MPQILLVRRDFGPIGERHLNQNTPPPTKINCACEKFYIISTTIIRIILISLRNAEKYQNFPSRVWVEIWGRTVAFPLRKSEGWSLMAAPKKQAFDISLKLLLIGDSGRYILFLASFLALKCWRSSPAVGKTCMLLRFSDDTFSTDMVSTIGYLTPHESRRFCNRLTDHPGIPNLEWITRPSTFHWTAKQLNCRFGIQQDRSAFATLPTVSGSAPPHPKLRWLIRVLSILPRCEGHLPRVRCNKWIEFPPRESVDG